MSAPIRPLASRQPIPLEPLELRVLFAVPALLDPLTQRKFVNPLPLPSVLQPTTPGGTSFAVSVTQQQQDLGLVDPATGAHLSTTVWGYNGTYPGPTFVAHKGTPITVTYSNKLVDSAGKPLPHLLPVDDSIMTAYTGTKFTIAKNGVPVTVHLHGGHTEAGSDGGPLSWYSPGNKAKGPAFQKVYTYANDQDAATLWYHDHALGITRLNVYAGLAGFYLLRDGLDTGVPDDPATPQNEDPLGLPTGKYEFGAAIQDRMFTADGQLYYPSTDPANPSAPNPTILPEFFGDTMLVNGKAWPVMNVEPRKYRIHFLNGSDSRFLTLSLSNGTPFVQIGSDQGLLSAPLREKKITLGTGERADVVIDFSGLQGQTIILKNSAKTPFPAGAAVDPRTTGQIMAFKVGNTVTTPDVPMAASFQTIVPLRQTGPTRQVALNETTDRFGRVTAILGTPTLGFAGFGDPVSEVIKLGDTEVWEVYNNTPDTHPIHLHLVKFQVLSRQKFTATVDPVTGVMSNIKLKGPAISPDANEAGWKDTVRMNPGEVTRIIATFDKPGDYVWHCHILSHEDHDMMRPFKVVKELPPAASTIAGSVATVSTETFSDVVIPGGTGAHAVALKKPADDTAAALLEATATPV